MADSLKVIKGTGSEANSSVSYDSDKHAVQLIDHGGIVGADFLALQGNVVSYNQEAINKFKQDNPHLVKQLEAQEVQVPVVGKNDSIRYERF